MTMKLNTRRVVIIMIVTLLTLAELFITKGESCAALGGLIGLLIILACEEIEERWHKRHHARHH